MKMKETITNIVLTVALFVGFIALVNAAEFVDYYEINEYRTNKTQLTFSWDAPVDSVVEGYEVKEIWMDRDFSYDTFETTETQVVIDRRRTGHFIYCVRAFNTKQSTQERQYSSWSCSDDATVSLVPDQNQNLVSGAWNVYWDVPEPGNLIID